MSQVVPIDCLVIGAGISGIAVGRWLKQYDVDFVIMEKSNDIAGLWRFREQDYGVMSFTHINVSKYNYCFSDFPFPDGMVEYMHHSHIYDYAKAYIDKHQFMDRIKFEHQVVRVEQVPEAELGELTRPTFRAIKSYDKLWRVHVKDVANNNEVIYLTPYCCVCSGHHGTPRYAKFAGQETFKGDIIHSVQFKDATKNKMVGKRVLLVGIGNSAVDAADNLVSEGRCPKVHISSRSGSWILPNYLEGYTGDLYVNRFSFCLPYSIRSRFLESVVKGVHGDPSKYNLNPKMGILQAHPTVSPTIYHHIQRGKVHIKPDIQQISGNVVTFENGEKEEYDAIVLCTGYKIDLDILSADLKKKVFKDKDEKHLDLFKFVFQPDIGKSLSFIGYVQPHSGGILPISEIQARWFVYLMMEKISLPSTEQMRKLLKKEESRYSYFKKSDRHTIQCDPVLLNDEIADFFGAKPSYVKNPAIAWRLLFGANGPAQWRLQGIDADPKAIEYVLSVPVPPKSANMCKFLCAIVLVLLLCLFKWPVLIPIVATMAGLYTGKKKFLDKQADEEL